MDWAMTFEEWEKGYYAATGMNPAACDYSWDDMKAAWDAAIEEAAKVVDAHYGGPGEPGIHGDTVRDAFKAAPKDDELNYAFLRDGECYEWIAGEWTGP